jgi:dTDP-4-amino-4,6-dideoxygalactose transaminase
MVNLAIKGGERTIKIEPPHYKWPCITKKTEEAVKKQLYDAISIYDKSGIIDKLERKFADYYGRKYALLTNSGTTALYSVYVGAGLKEGDEVICPAYTFFATVTPLFFTGAIPVLVDCKEDGNIDPREIKRKISNKTKAIVITHMWGIPCDMDSILEIAEKYGLMLFEDASHAHGAKYKGKKIGTFGDASVFSLQAQKLVSGGEGGILLTDNEEIYYRALLLGHYNKRCKQEIPQSHPLFRYYVTGMGLKLRIHPIAAAIAYQQFNDLEKILTQKREFAIKIINELAKLPCIKTPEVLDNIEPSWYALPLQYEPEKLGGLTIEKFHEALLAEGCIEIDRPSSTCPLNYLTLFQHPEGLFPSYKGKISYRKGDFPKAENLHKNLLKIPVWYNPTDQYIVDLYIKAFKKIVENYEELLL